MSESLRLFIQHVSYMCWKELLATLKDKRMRFILILPALLQGFLFGYAATYNLENVPYVVVDESHTQASHSLLARVEGTTAFSLAATLRSPAEIHDWIDSESAILAIVIPSDFEAQLSKGNTASIQIITDGRNTSIAGMAAGYVSTIVSSWNADRRGTAGAVTIDSRTWYNPNETTRWMFLPSLIATISFVQVVMLAGLSIAKEREQGTFDQLLVTPLSPAEILIGKAVPPMLIGLLQSGILFCITYFWFRVPFAGSLLTLSLTIVIFMLSSTGIGLSISSIAENMQQVLVYVFLTLMPLSLLSGLATPVRNMPEFLQILTYANPMRFAITAVRRIYLEGAGLADIATNFIPMLVVAAVTMPLAAWLFRHKTT